jgi:hypothetical protein
MKEVYMRSKTPVSIKILVGLIILSAVLLFLEFLEAQIRPSSLSFQVPLLVSLSLVFSPLLAIVYVLIGIGIWKMRRWAWRMGMIFFILGIFWNSLMEVALKTTIDYTIWRISSPPEFLGIMLNLIILILLWYKRKSFINMFIIHK